MYGNIMRHVHLFDIVFEHISQKQINAHKSTKQQLEITIYEREKDGVEKEKHQETATKKKDIDKHALCTHNLQLMY